MIEQSELEFLLSRYVARFNEELPEFSATLSEKNICEILRKCLRSGQSLRAMPEVDFLQLQYRAKFDEPLSYNFMTLWSEQDLLTALRESLNTGKPYKPPSLPEGCLV